MSKTTSPTIKTELSLQHLDINGLPLHSLVSDHDYREKPILLFLHGFPDSAWVWLPILRQLSSEYSVIAPFVRGTYEDERPARVPRQRYGIESWCLDLLSLLNHQDASKSRKVLIIAHDLGGAYGRTLSDYLGEQTQGLIFINSMGVDQYMSRINNWQQWLKSYYIFLFQLQGVTEFFLKGLHPFSLNFIYDRGKLNEMDTMRDEKKYIFGAVEQYRQILRSAPKHLLKKREPSTIPTLFIWGENDPFLEIPTQYEVDKFYQSSQIRVLDGSHWLMKTHTPKIVRYIQKFIKEQT